MSALKNIKKTLWLMVGSMIFASTVQAAEQVRASFDMEANGISYRIFTAAPAEAAPEGGYPVIYMVDGNRMLPLAAAEMAKNDDLKAVLVGIGYPTDDADEIVRLRYFDLTSATSEQLTPDPANQPKTGGRDAFFAFIEVRVKPEIEKRFSIDKSRQALFGHSLGGLFTLYALFNHTNSFQTYSAADPSIWWDNHSILSDKDRFIASFKSAPHPLRLLMETSGKRGSRPGQSPADIQRMRKLRGGPSGTDVYKELEPLPQLETAFHRFANEGHGSMIPLTVADSLNFILLGRKPEHTDN
ncbi:MULTISPECIES: alpha/beta hydrolase [Ochrobactrum]|uniref:alpha/beta hydrolase n=1 Tax=Ochrobactrum TaxID=528 RepID=UPI000EF264E1|nr:alpha/beta hydrolase-fold protein [[Ochrobactrum] soli]MCI1001694.1 alpha/beta hydrolase [Ochrobactrum sp. C6C9]RLL64880.1 alpha/beta hydrolase [[Ochrobactrum] soli]